MGKFGFHGPGDAARVTELAKAASVGVAFLFLGAWICFEALQVPLGSFRMPGAGAPAPGGALTQRGPSGVLIGLRS